MERYRLKNLILLILALANVFLLSSLLFRQAQENNVRRDSLQQLTTLFHSKKYDLDLLVERIPDETPTAVLSLSRDSKRERRLASFFLGKELRYSAEGGGIIRYDSAAGSAMFYVGGSFELTLAAAEPLDDPEGYCIRFFRKFRYKELESNLRDGTGTITATQYFDGHPVKNGSVTFTFAGGVLQTVSGRCLPENYSGAEERPCINARTALTSFLQYFTDTGLVCKAITAIDLCYELQSTPAIPLSLTPVWRLSTDTGQSFYVNSVTGEVSQ